MRKEKRGDELERLTRPEESRDRILERWVPITGAGKIVRNGEVTSLDDFFARGHKVMEPEIVNALVPELKEKLVEIRKTARITKQGRSFSFRAAVLIGDGESYIGLGTAKDRERYPAVSKAKRNAKLSIMKVRKGCGSWECRCRESHSVPFRVEGSSSSVRVTFMPAPKGTGLVVGDKIKDVLRFVGIRDAWSKCWGNTASTLDFVSAGINALAATNKVRLSGEMERKLEEKK